MRRVYQWKPAKWFIWAPVMAGLPALAASWISSPPLWREIQHRAEASLGENSGLKVEMDGRDAMLSGDADSRESLEKAIKAVSSTYGVRNVDVSRAAVSPAAQLPAPTIKIMVTNNSTPTLTGTWPQVAAESLDIMVGDKTYALGKDKSVSSADGKWILALPTTIPDGVYDVIVSVTDKAGTTSSVKAKSGLVIDTKAPDAPVFDSSPKNLTWPFAITGTWPEDDATSLKFDFQNKSYLLGTAMEFKSDGKGKFKFEPKTVLPVGRYDLTATLVDKLGNAKTYDIPKAIVIAEPETMPAPDVTISNPDVLPSPTVSPVQTFAARPILRGTWPANAAKGFKITVAGHTYELGKSPELLDDALGNWMLKTARDLPPGTYDVMATAVSTANVVASDSTKDELVIKPAPRPAPVVAPLAAPTVNSLQSSEEVTELTGTWPAKEASALQVAVAGDAFELGKSSNLTFDGTDKWQLKLGKPLGEGTYDVEVTVTGSGNRQVKDASSDEIVIALPPPPPPPPPKKLPAPTIARLKTSDSTPLLEGTWPESDATSLTVKIGESIYELRKSAELKSSGGKWSLAIPAPLADGTYDVGITVADKEGNIQTENGVAALRVDTTAPTAPSMIPVAANATWPYPLMGSWPEADAKSLAIEFNGKTYKLGSHQELTSDGKGTFTFTPVDQLAPGSYDMTVTMSDMLGNQSASAVKAVVFIPQPEKPPALKQVEEPVAKKPADNVLKTTGYDCATDLNRITQSFPVRFEYRTADITAQHDLSLGQIASLLRDPRCVGVRIEVEGHTDFRGTKRYNQVLSELRAERVVRALVNSGVPANRFIAVGRSEFFPSDPSRSAIARAKNRRVEFRVVK